MSTPATATDTPRGRTYDIGGQVVPSVTTVLSLVSKPALVSSAVKITADAAVYKNKQLFAIQKESGEDAALRWIKGLYRAEWDAKKNIGSAVHKGIHNDILGIDAWPTAHAAHRASWERLKAETVPIFEMAEATVFSLRPGHAGTLDTIAVLTGERVPAHLRDKRGLFDVKTGSSPRDGGIWFEEMIQLATYRHSPFLLMPDGTHQPMPAIDYTAVLHIDARGYRVTEVPEADEAAYRVFQYLLAVHNFKEAHRGVIGVDLQI